MEFPLPLVAWAFHVPFLTAEALWTGFVALGDRLYQLRSRDIEESKQGGELVDTLTFRFTHTEHPLLRNTPPINSELITSSE